MEVTDARRPPKVSVVIPAYQASRDIAPALESVFAQTFGDHEVIVINDGSPDTTQLEFALKPFASRIAYVAQPNRGAGAARNTGIRESRGTYIAFLDADDRWEPEFLRRQVRYLDTRPDRDLVYCDALVTGESPLAGRRFMEKAPSSGPVTLLSLIDQRCNIILSTVVVRRRTIVAGGLFDEALRRGHDFDLWLRLAHLGASIGYQRHVLAERRVNAGGLSGGAIAELQRAMSILERFGRRHDLDSACRTAVRLRLMTLVDRLEIEQAKQRLAEGNFAAARYHLAAPRRQPLKLRLARAAIRVAPSLVRSAWLRLRPSVWAPRPAIS